MVFGHFAVTASNSTVNAQSSIKKKTLQDPNSKLWTTMTALIILTVSKIIMEAGFPIKTISRIILFQSQFAKLLYHISVYVVCSDIYNGHIANQTDGKDLKNDYGLIIKPSTDSTTNSYMSIVFPT